MRRMFADKCAGSWLEAGECSMSLWKPTPPAPSGPPCSDGGLRGMCLARSQCAQDDVTAGKCASGICCITNAGKLFSQCANGVVDAGEQCQPKAGSCCSKYCRIQPIGELCRPSAGPCDAPELCDGGARLIFSSVLITLYEQCL